MQKTSNQRGFIMFFLPIQGEAAVLAGFKAQTLAEISKYPVLCVSENFRTILA